MPSGGRFSRDFEAGAEKSRFAKNQNPEGLDGPAKVLQSPLPSRKLVFQRQGTNLTKDSRVIASFTGSLTSEHGLDATRMWQADRLHAVSPQGSADAGGLVRSGAIRPAESKHLSCRDKSIILLPKSQFLELSLRCFELLSMDERLATVSEVEGRGGISQGFAAYAICHKADSSGLKRTVRKARKAKQGYGTIRRNDK